MPANPTKLLVSRMEALVCVKIEGKATCASCFAFKRLMTEVIKGGTTKIVIDLAECPFMDSSFLGVMAGAGIELGEALNPTLENTGGDVLRLLNPQQRVVESLESLGMTHLFHVITASADQPGRFEEVQLGEATKLDNTRTCLEAHRLLMELNKENVTKFQDVTTFLAKDLKRLEGGTP
jgi:anti-anti-sigma factor